MSAVAVLLLTLVAVALALVAAIVLARRRPGPPPRAWRPGRSDRAPTGAAGRSVTLDLEAVDPGAPAVRRLVEAAAAPLLAADPALDAVEVRDRNGVLIGVVERAVDGSDAVVVAVPGLPHVTGGDRGGRGDDEETLALREREPTVRDGAFADRFDLPPAVAARLGPEADLVDLVRALLEAAGRDVEVEDDVVRSGEEAVVALGATHPDALSAGYLRYRRSGARRGLALSLRDVGAHEVARRERLAPDLRYGGPAAIQRMADAVAVGADPFRFALGPPSVGRS